MIRASFIKPAFALIAIAAASSVMAGPLLAQEASGCDAFKWPLDHERALLANPVKAASGDPLAQPFAATLLSLAPLAQAQLPMAPSRPPKAQDAHAGFVKIAAPPHTGTYRITIARKAWIDVIQNGRELKSIAFTGARDCAGLAKSVKFSLEAAPFILEFSDVPAESLAFVVTPD